MRGNDFIFSNRFNYRLTRHLVFWILYCTYFYIQSIPPRKFDEFFIARTYYTALMNLCCFAPVFITAVYFFIYYLLPRTLQKKKYLLFAFSFLLVYAVGTFINYFTATVFLYYTGYFPMTFQHKIEMSNFNTRWGMVIAIIALGIKSSKNWWLQQKENLAILKKKTRAEMQLQKSRIHPQLLLRSLDSIYTNIQTKSGNASTMILNLSELLSYSLYETGVEQVPLEKELQQLQHLVALEQTNAVKPVYIQLHTEGIIDGKCIAPMVIVKLLEETITALHAVEKDDCLLDVDVSVSDSDLLLTLRCADGDEETSENVKWPLLMESAHNRLSEFYTGAAYKIELTKNKQETIMRLKIYLPASSMKINEDIDQQVKPILYEPA